MLGKVLDKMVTKKTGWIAAFTYATAWAIKKTHCRRWAMGWGKAQVSVKSLKIFDNKRGLSKLLKPYIDKKIRKLIRYD